MKRMFVIAVTLGIGLVLGGPAPGASAAEVLGGPAPGASAAEVLGGPAPGASAAEQQEPEVAPCRVQRGTMDVHEDVSIAVGSATIGSCVEAIRARSGTGTWGPYEIEVNGDSWVHINGEAVGVLLQKGTDDHPTYRDDLGGGG